MNSNTSVAERMGEFARFETLADWQDWVAQNWEHPIGSKDAQLHTRAKLQEEVAELGNALISGSDEQIKDELGDVLWTATGTAFNAGITLEECLYYDEGDNLPVSLNDLDTHIASIDRSPFEFSSPEAELLRLSEADYSVPFRQIQASSLHLGKGAKQYFVWDTENNPGADAWALVKRQRAIKGLREIIIACGIIAQDKLGITLTEVMEHNRQKLTSRIQSGEPVTKSPEQFS